jgi:hypothetical protein
MNLIHYLNEYEKFNLHLEEKFPGNPDFLRFAKRWLEKAQEYARTKNKFLTPPSVANTKEGDGIVFFWESNPFVPFVYHDYGFFNNGKAGFFRRDITEVIDYSDPNSHLSHEDIPFAETVDSFAIAYTAHNS